MKERGTPRRLTAAHQVVGAVFVCLVCLLVWGMRENKTDKLPQRWFRSNNVQLWRVFMVQASEGRMNGSRWRQGCALTNVDWNVNNALVQTRNLYLYKVKNLFKKHKNLFTNARIIESTQMIVDSRGPWYHQDEPLQASYWPCPPDLLWEGQV